MSKVMTLLILSFITQIFAVTVDGYAFLEGETDHSGIEVFFQRVAPDNSYNYTVYTDTTGYYSSVVENGLYEAFFSKGIDFKPDSVLAVNCYSDVTLDSLILEIDTTIHGSISGILTTGEYEVSSTLTVEAADTLVIEPGVILNFYPGTEFIINGLLLTKGTDTDSNKFTSLSGQNWEGISILDNEYNSKFDFCIIENSQSDGLNGNNSLFELTNCSVRNNIGSGISLSMSDNIRVYKTIITNNFSYYNNGGGISLYGCDNVIISNSEISNNTLNTSYSNGGGVYVYDCDNLEISNSVISNNIAKLSYSSGGGSYVYDCSNLIISNSKISGNTLKKWSSNGGGIYIEESGNVTITGNNIINNVNQDIDNTGGGISVVKTHDLNIEKCIIKGNRSDLGGGISVFLYTTGNISNSIIENNFVTKFGGGIYHLTPSIVYNNLIIWNNARSGVYTASSNPATFRNCIIANNYWGYGIHNNSADPSVENCNLYNNDYADVFNCNDYLLYNVITNTNVNSCDAWYNILMDPMFVDAENGDFRLQSGSPCIDAGINTISGYEFPIGDIDGNYRIWDGDGNGSEIVDMGAYEYASHSTSIDNEQLIIENYTLSQNYPNPFNPETLISYSLKNNAQINLKVYDITGREVAELVNKAVNVGMHSVKFDGSNLTSGIYFYQLSIDGKVEASKKMMLLK